MIEYCIKLLGQEFCFPTETQMYALLGHAIHDRIINQRKEYDITYRLHDKETNTIEEFISRKHLEMSPKYKNTVTPVTHRIMDAAINKRVQ